MDPVRGPEGALARVVEAAASDDPDAAVRTCRSCYAAPIRADLITEALRRCATPA